MQRIETIADLERGLDALMIIDPRLEKVRAQATVVDLRRTQPGFASLAAVIVGQQLSRASAHAILARLNEYVGALTPVLTLEVDEADLIKAGLSRAKQRTLLALAAAIAEGRLDLDHLLDLPTDEAVKMLVQIPGIGPWTAEVYLLSAAGHPDIFPSGDVALQAAVHDALELPGRPKPRTLATIAAAWQPWRSVAARLFWAYYRELKGREAFPLP